MDALAQTTKQGYLYLFDRVTGKPLFPIEEMPVAKSDLPGEVSSPTQPHPILPKPYARQFFDGGSVDDADARGACVGAERSFRAMKVGTAQFTPFALDQQDACGAGVRWGARSGVVRRSTARAA